MARNGTVLVVAPSYRQFCFEMEELAIKQGCIPDVTSKGFSFGGKNYRYVWEPDQMRGCRDVEVIFVGDYLTMKNLMEFKDMVVWIRGK